MQGKYISVILFCIVFCILIAPVSAAEYCSFINITAGPQGVQGIQGIQGIPGLNNLTPNWTAGPKGDKGDQGSQGYQGVNGTPGTPGYTPIFGIDYFNGDQGIQGINGTPGVPGSQGIQGINGTPGTPGAKGDKGDTGDQGIPGLNNMTQGIQGEQGIPGPNNDAWYIWVNATRAFTGSLSMGNNQITSLITGLTGDSAVNRTFVNAVNDTMRNNISINFPTTSLLTAVNDSMRNNVSLNFAPIVSGKVPTVNLGGAGADATKYLRGDQSWQVPSGGSGLGYTLYVSHLTTSPADNVKNYWGMNPLAPSTTGAVRKVPIPATGTIKEVHVAQNSGTAGTAEAYDLYVYKNNVINNSTGFVGRVSASASIRLWDNTTMALAVTKGDYIEMCFVNPTWATNPLTTISNGFIYVG